MPYVAVALFGLAFGSFLNVCISRIPRQESVIRPRSHCPRCGRPIRWFDNIPVVSYAVLCGRCRDCRERISPVYPAIEILTAGLLVAAFARYQLSPEFIKTALAGMLLLVLTITDLIARRIPHQVTVFGIGTGVLLSLVIPVDDRPVGWFLARLGFSLDGTISSLAGAASGALLGGGLFYAVGQAFYYLGGRQKEYLGFGDVMLMLMVGTFLGAPLTLLTIFLGSLAGTLIALPLTLANPKLREYEWPYGTFLGIAAIFSSLAGNTLLEAYFRWAGLG